MKTDDANRVTPPAINAHTQEQIDDYERYRSAELGRYFALVKVASVRSSRCAVDDKSENPAIVLGTD